MRQENVVVLTDNDIALAIGQYAMAEAGIESASECLVHLGIERRGNGPGRLVASVRVPAQPQAHQASGNEEAPEQTDVRQALGNMAESLARLSRQFAEVACVLADRGTERASSNGTCAKAACN